VLAFDVIFDTTQHHAMLFHCYDVMEFRPYFGAQETAQQSKGIPRAIRPINQAFPLLDHCHRMGGQTSEEGLSFIYFCIFFTN
jgi:hypothetical protein